MHSLPLGFVTTPTPRASPAPQPTPIPWYPLPPLWIIHVPVWEHFLLPFSTDRWMIPRWSRMEEPPMEHSTVPQVPLTQWWCHLKIRRFHDYICLHFISPSYSLNILFFWSIWLSWKGLVGGANITKRNIWSYIFEPLGNVLIYEAIFQPYSNNISIFLHLQWRSFFIPILCFVFFLLI